MNLPSIVGAIWAQSLNGVIGYNNQLPSEFLSDLKYFRLVTQKSTVVMGRKTWESLPKKPLPNRVNVVLTRNKDYKTDGAFVINSLDELEVFTDAVYFIGGKEIYDLALPYINHLHVTVNSVIIEGDTYAPDFRLLTSQPDWHLVTSTTETDYESSKNNHTMFFRKKG